ncbi:hypothetical protein TNCV_1613401 [Trichonephila clavipes]|nr:hypothetical protein TNCV_1613401 [Trichonephila clavipes]
MESIRPNVRWTSRAEDPKKTTSNYRISIGRAEEHVRETSPALLMAETTIPLHHPGMTDELLGGGVEVEGCITTC